MFETKILDDYKGYGKCLYVTNGTVDLIFTIDVGPRIVRYGFVNEQNILLDDYLNCVNMRPTSTEQLRFYYGEDAWHSYFGGHRLIVAPEYYPRTYYPDNKPVPYEIIENGVILTPDEQKINELQMRMTVTLSESGPEVFLKHEITNTAKHNQEFAVWTPTLCNKGGVEILRRNTSYLPFMPNQNIVTWKQTDFTADYLYLGKKFFTIANPVDESLKLGFSLEHGEAHYVLNDDVFTKFYSPNYPNGVYTDMGCSYETYSCCNFTELETLGEYKTVGAGETSEHCEKWTLRKKPCDFDRKDEASIENMLSKL